MVLWVVPFQQKRHFVSCCRADLAIFIAELPLRDQRGSHSVC
jgi:hypothetical protein